MMSVYDNFIDVCQDDKTFLLKKITFRDDCEKNLSNFILFFSFIAQLLISYL